MTTTFAAMLILHVLLGLTGVILSFMVTYSLLKTEVRVRFVRCLSTSAFIAYVLSWLSGGYYYWFYYGAKVKPVIMGGSYKWAHLVFTESKEHVFLFLPFVSLVLAVLLYAYGNELAVDADLKKRTFRFSLAITVVAIIVTLSGILITGGAR